MTFGFALIIIYLALAALFESFRDPLIILVSVPMSIAGALIFISVGMTIGLLPLANATFGPLAAVVRAVEALINDWVMLLQQHKRVVDLVVDRPARPPISERHPGRPVGPAAGASGRRFRRCPRHSNALA